MMQNGSVYKSAKCVTTLVNYFAIYPITSLNFNKKNKKISYFTLTLKLKTSDTRYQIALMNTFQNSSSYETS